MEEITTILRADAMRLMLRMLVLDGIKPVDITGNRELADRLTIYISDIILGTYPPEYWSMMEYVDAFLIILHNDHDCEEKKEIISEYEAYMMRYRPDNRSTDDDGHSTDDDGHSSDDDGVSSDGEWS